MGNSLFLYCYFSSYAIFLASVFCSYERTLIITHGFSIPLSVRYNFTGRGCSECLVAKKAVKSGSRRSYISFLVKDLLKLRTTLGNTSFFYSALKTAPKKLLVLKSFLTNLGNVALIWGLQVRTTDP